MEALVLKSRIMREEMIEALRLTREGRMAEAQELIGRALGQGAGQRPGSTRAYVVNPPQLEPPGAAAPKDDARDSERNPTGQEGAKAPWRALPPFIGSKKTFMGKVRADILGKLHAHAPAGRKIPIEMVAPPAGRWLDGTHTSQAGTRSYK